MRDWTFKLETHARHRSLKRYVKNVFLMLCIALLCLCLESMAAKTQLPRDAFHRLLWQSDQSVERPKGREAESQREMLGHLQGAESFSTWDVPGTLTRKVERRYRVIDVEIC